MLLHSSHALFLAVAPLLSFAGGQTQERQAVPAPRGVQAGAVQAAEFTLQSLQNWCAVGLEGASWIFPTSRSTHAEGMVRRGDGVAAPKARVESIHASFTRYGRERIPTYRVELNLRLQARDDLLTATRVLEDFCESMDEFNGDLMTSMGRIVFDPLTKSLHAPDVYVYLPATEHPTPLPSVSRPMTEVVRRANRVDGQMSGISVSTKRKKIVGGEGERVLDLSMGQKDDRLTVSNSGAFLHRLALDEDPLWVDSFHLQHRAKAELYPAGWMLHVTLKVAD